MFDRYTQMGAKSRNSSIYEYCSKRMGFVATVIVRLLEKEELLESRDPFKGLDAYRNATNKVESLAYFIFELTPDSLTYAEQLDKDLSSTTSATRKQKDNKLKKQQVKWLISKAIGRHRY